MASAPGICSQSHQWPRPHPGHVRIVPCQQWDPHVQRIAPTQVQVPLLDVGVKPNPRAKLAIKHCLITNLSGVWGNVTSTREEYPLLCSGSDSWGASHEEQLKLCRYSLKTLSWDLVDLNRVVCSGHCPGGYREPVSFRKGRQDGDLEAFLWSGRGGRRRIQLGHSL